MKIFKSKIWPVVFFGVFWLIILAPIHKASAFMNTPINKDGINLSFKDRTTISGTVNGVSVTYVDSNPWDTTYNYAVQQSGIFCKGSSPSNITILSDGIAPSGGSSQVTGRLDARTSTDGTQNGCTVNNSVQFSVGNPSAGMDLLQWQSSGKLEIINGASLTEVGTTDVYESDPNGSCGGGRVAVVTDSGATIYDLSTTGVVGGGRGGGISYPPASSFSGLDSSSLANNCYVHKINNQDVTTSSDYQSLAKQQYGIGGTRPTAGTGAVGAGGGVVNPPAGGGNNPASTCDANFNSAFSWIVCPMLSFADSAIGFFYGQVENQLCFNTGASSSAGAYTCGKTKDTSLTSGVKSAWSIFKNIASALLVIVMLVMVISQAVGGGPFDAYTVRKMLPKLVAAVIIMQLSWILLKFAIDLSNDAGATIGNLMMAPFGGPSHMDLGSMLGKAVNIATGSQPGQVTFDVFAAIAGVAIFVWAIPALPLLALYVFTGAFIAFFTLILRKLLIIMLVILAPLAFIAWLLPGTEKYWKLWSDNFSKLLIMFPMIMAMLSAGRIFAYITSLSGNGATMFNPHLAVAHVGFLPIPYIASATGFVDIVIVLVAFFAPYFILPKTYSWGGQLMGQAGKAVENYTNKGAEPAKKLLKNREESYRAERRRKSQIRTSRNEGFNILKPWQKPVDSLRSGQWDPTLGLPRSRRRQTNVTRYAAQGAEELQKEVKEAELRQSLLFEQVDDHDALARAIAAGDSNYTYTTHDGKNHKLGRLSEAERQAGLGAVAKFGGGSNFRFLDRQIAHLREHGTVEEKTMAKSFLDANAQSLLPKMKHMYYGENRDKAIQSMVGSMSENSFVGMEGAEMEAILESLADQVNRGVPRAEERLARVMTFYEAAIDNENIRPNIGSGVSQAMEAFVDGQNLASINSDRQAAGHPGISRRAAGAPSVAPLVRALHGRIDRFGNVSAPAAAPAPAAGAPAPGGVVAPGGGGAAPAPGQGAFIPNGVINVQHNSPEGQIISANVGDIDNYVQTSGGWQHLSDGDLMNIYHFRTGEHKARAAEQLRARNLL